MVAEHHRAYREDQRHDQLTEEFGPGPQAQIALPAELDEVVEETDRAAAEHQEQQQQAGRGRPGVCRIEAITCATM